MPIRIFPDDHSGQGRQLASEENKEKRLNPYRVEHDTNPRVNAVYVYLQEIGPGEAVSTRFLMDLDEGVMINVDYNAAGEPIGVEIL